MANVYVNEIFGDRIDNPRLRERLLQVGPNPSGEVALALIVEQLLERIEGLEARVLDKFPEMKMSDLPKEIGGLELAVRDNLAHHIETLAAAWLKANPGLSPNDAELVQENDGTCIRWYFRRRENP